MYSPESPKQQALQSCSPAYVGRPETDTLRRTAMQQLGGGLTEAGHHEAAVSVQEADLSTMRRTGAPEVHLLLAQNNLAITYSRIGRHEEALRLKRDVYSGTLQLHGEEHEGSLLEATNYASSLLKAKRFAEVKSLMRKTVPAARRVLGKGDTTTLRMRWVYALALYLDGAGTLDDVREAVTKLEEIVRTARRLLGSAHPMTKEIEGTLQNARAALRDRETPPTSK